jgi:ribosomal protein L16 Arg81 hydroxylase
MKRFIVTKKQLNEYVERKRNERVFNQIIEDLNKNAKLLNENVSHNKANQSVIDNYKRKNLITPKIQEMLVKHKIINEKCEIIQ